MGRHLEKGKKVADSKDSHTYYEKGSEENGGRKIAVTRYKGKDGKWHTKTKNAARDKYQRSGHHVGKDQDVDHKDSNHDNDKSSNLHAMSKSKNVAKENKRRAGKK
jgi:hypothetical protein